MNLNEGYEFMISFREFDALKVSLLGVIFGIFFCIYLYYRIINLESKVDEMKSSGSEISILQDVTETLKEDITVLKSKAGDFESGINSLERDLSKVESLLKGYINEKHNIVY